MRLPLGVGAYLRTSVGVEPQIEMFNRFFEENPTNLEEGVALLARGGTTFYNTVGSGPIRRIWSQPGTLGGDIFMVSGNNMFRVPRNTAAGPGTPVLLPGDISDNGTPEIDGTANFVFVADGQNLFFFNGEGDFSTATLTATGNPQEADTVTIGSVTYTFTATVDMPNEILIGATPDESLNNLALATVADTGTGAGTLFGLDTDPNPFARAAAGDDPMTLLFTAISAGALGNGISLSTASPFLSFDGPALSGGTANALVQIPTPDDVAIVSIAVLAQFVLCVAANSQRVYFIRPGETTIDPLDFFESERRPDEINVVRVYGDQAYFLGEESIEVWFVSGVEPVPFDRVQGRVIERGSVNGTELIVNDSVMFVGDDGVVYSLTGGLNRVSHHGIEERIRTARETEQGLS